ncbi:phospholipase A2 isoform X2 [Bombyx mori]|uniref:Phospholipase A2 n=1 Tax=Bombyx mori TaxID=7091 RepID=A0A8R2AMB5_BOMMO|nr:phospholipase A2 [Bombyx mori]
MFKMIACWSCFIVLIALYVNRVTGSWFANDSAVNIDKDVLDIQSERIARKKFDFIFPGTKWCGKGDIAKNYEDLGSARETDMCCREHDHCTDLILAGETKHGLTNDAFYTRLNCKCDEAFRLCLNKANTKTSRRIGKIYFNALGTKCYRRDYPVVGCNTYGGLFRKKCLEYDYDTRSEQIYQWFDVRNYAN